MNSVGAGYFKEHCLELLAGLGAQGLVITLDGKPIAKVIPHEEAPQQKLDDKWKRAVLNGSLKDKITIHGDIFSTGIQWDAESGHPHSDLHR